MMLVLAYQFVQYAAQQWKFKGRLAFHSVHLILL